MGAFSSGGGPILLQPGESREVFYGLGEVFLDNLWLSDQRLNVPSSNRLVLSVPFTELTKEGELHLAEETTEGAREVVLEEVLQTADLKWAKSPATPFEVIQPKGIDEQVWETLQLSADGAWTVNRWGKGTLASDVVNKYPSSGYAPYALIHARATELQDYVGVVEQILRVHGDSPVAPEIARMAFELRYTESVGNSDLPTRLRRRSQAESALTSVLKNPKVPEWWKAKVREVADSLPSEQKLIELHDRATDKQNGN